MRGSFCSLNTRCPTHEELDTCTHVLLSDEHQWNPTTVTFANVSAVDGERIVQSVEVVSEYENLLLSCGLVTGIELVKRAISSIQVDGNKRKRKRSKSSQHDGGSYIPPMPFNQSSDYLYTSERHHKANPVKVRSLPSAQVSDATHA